MKVWMEFMMLCGADGCERDGVELLEASIVRFEPEAVDVWNGCCISLDLRRTPRLYSSQVC